MVTVDASVWIAGFDATDALHSRSAAFLRAAIRQRTSMHGPAVVLVEVGCALARRSRDPSAGRQAANTLTTNLLLRIWPLDEALLALALQIGSERFLRGTDACYAATAQLASAELISWDKELIARAGALTPDAWLAAQR